MPRIGEVGRTLRNVKRYQEILSALFHYGFADFIADTRLDQWIGFSSAPAAELDAATETVVKLPRAVRLRRVLEKLGPIYIKLGQILSTRPDLIPPDLVEEFKQLQDRCSQLPYGEVREVLEAEFQGEVDKIFLSIEEQPIAAGSLAQVHRAKLAGGEHAVIKVLRPNVRNLIRSDIEVLTRIAEFVEWHFTELGYSATEVVREFAIQLKRETDLTLEGRSTERLQEYFRNDPHVSFPIVYWSATTRNVLTMEEITGTALSRLDLNSLSPEERRRVVGIGTDAVLKQCLQFGFFHADPHPGNLFLCGGQKLCFVDCGMTGHLDRGTSEELADLLLGIATMDLDRVASVIVALTGGDLTLTRSREFREDLWKLMAYFDQASFERLDIPQLLNEFFALLRNYSIRCPADLVFLIKAVATIEGVGRELDPSFNLVAHIRPYLERLMRRRYGIPAVRDRFFKSVLRYAEFVEDLPQELQGLLAQLRSNRFNVNLEHKNLDSLSRSIEHASHSVSLALIITGLLVCSSVLVLASRISEVEHRFLLVLGIVGLGAASLLILLLVLGNYRYRKN